MKKHISLLLECMIFTWAVCMIFSLAACGEAIPTEPESESQPVTAGIDYLALVNKVNPLPDGWEDALKTVTITNSVGDEVEVRQRPVRHIWP